MKKKSQTFFVKKKDVSNGLVLANKWFWNYADELIFCQ